MANTTNLNIIFEALSLIPKIHFVEKIQKKSKRFNILSKKNQEVEENLQIKTTRRLALSIGIIATFANSRIGDCLADDNNGFFINGPLPVPSVSNDIINKETGTRSFLKKGMYIANIGTKGRIHRLKRYAFDLLALGDLIGTDAWNYVRKYLRIKSTFMYYDFDEVITAAEVNDKQPLTDLANRLFDNVEKLEDAVKKKNLPQTQTCYQETTNILQEVMDKMA
ncbi:Photosynthetic NDH subunit of lumenal location 3, chloroplastic [Capsicum annuum]|uniref:Photosynthetic NDH subunit of lumenal location 3, chloroplastic n=1 Tax=Capsicum annuum TaxID=4072 RepID=A0A1U8EF34_CAPAN|nr:photosynthetic NDH subunit of lumenal location 3, chloroplastic isoform X1 [Capsicum annuum]KAF3614263.1 Photosynthetic NDH subunit of lumenal location 3, chloroplastic [Capsicum annuum]KAF3617062.1 Photosynthetic NDH subunit of lumenal location 3, chloroplastic [Capsicum annuum]PHT62869.1 Photosynthetic NDH subunit of lumenal location 3, chloroplastic [Capsicum annuum]